MLTGFDVGGTPPAPPPFPGGRTAPARSAPLARPPRKAEPLTLDDVLANRRRGRGALSNPTGRFEAETRESEAADEASLPDPAELATVVTVERPRTVITRNDSPDISFDRSINPYRGCEHGCVYCFARPTHAFVGLSPGLDFETKLFVKEGAAEKLERELAAPSYRPRTVAIGTSTDPYQPIERERRVMRGILEVLERCDHPIGIITKSALVARDIDLLAPMAAKGLVKVAVSVTTLDPALARLMEPRAPAPRKRLDAIRRLSEAGIPVTVMAAPLIPAVNDHEVEAILAAARAAGAAEAGYVVLRLPLEVRDLFRDWLMAHFPDKLRHVMGLVQSMRDGQDYDPSWGKRMTGTGPYAWMLGRRFEVAAAKLGFPKTRAKLRTDLFKAPTPHGQQLSLF